MSLPNKAVRSLPLYLFGGKRKNTSFLCETKMQTRVRLLRSSHREKRAFETDLRAGIRTRDPDIRRRRRRMRMEDMITDQHTRCLRDSLCSSLLACSETRISDVFSDGDSLPPKPSFPLFTDFQVFRFLSSSSYDFLPEEQVA